MNFNNQFLTDTRLQYDNNANPGIASNAFSTVPMNYPFTHTSQNNTQLSVLKEPNIEYSLYDYYINISSTNRDSTNYPLHYNYRINFDTPYKNIKSIELISVIFPNQPAASSGGDILNEPFLVIDIDEINYIEFPNNTGSNFNKGFSILPLKTPNKSTGGFIIPELGCTYHTAKVYKTPLASLNSMTIKIRNINGDLYDFGQTNGSTDKAYQNHLVFKITVEEKSRDNINHRNVF